jgi:hypothetical protein
MKETHGQIKLFDDTNESKRIDALYGERQVWSHSAIAPTPSASLIPFALYPRHSSLTA